MHLPIFCCSLVQGVPWECFPGDGLDCWHAVLDSENQKPMLKMPPTTTIWGSKASEVIDLDKNKIVFPG